jgi:hypothetical protein
LESEKLKLHASRFGKSQRLFFPNPSDSAEQNRG